MENQPSQPEDHNSVMEDIGYKPADPETTAKIRNILDNPPDLNSEPAESQSPTTEERELGKRQIEEIRRQIDKT